MSPYIIWANDDDDEEEGESMGKRHGRSWL